MKVRYYNTKNRFEVTFLFQDTKLNAKANLSIWRREYFFLSAILVLVLLSLTINSWPIKCISSVFLFLYVIQYRKSVWETEKYGTSPMYNFLTLTNAKKLIGYNFIKLMIELMPLCLAGLTVFYWFVLVGVESSYLYNVSVFAICLAVFLFSICFFIYIFYSYRICNYLLYEDTELSLKQYFEKSREFMKENKWELCKLDLSFVFWHLFSILSGFLGYTITYPYMSLAYVNWYKEKKE